MWSKHILLTVREECGSSKQISLFCITGRISQHQSWMEVLYSQQDNSAVPRGGYVITFLGSFKRNADISSQYHKNVT